MITRSFVRPGLITCRTLRNVVRSASFILLPHVRLEVSRARTPGAKEIASAPPVSEHL